MDYGAVLYFNETIYQKGSVTDMIWLLKFQVLPKLPTMKQDITNKAAIEKVVSQFYAKVKTDPLIGVFFTKVVPINWEKHLPLMCSFWENVLFYTGEYEGNVLETHRKVNQKLPTENIHFERWLQLFDETVDALYAGPNAEKMKERSKSIAAIMMAKM